MLPSILRGSGRLNVAPSHGKMGSFEMSATCGGKAHTLFYCNLAARIRLKFAIKLLFQLLCKSRYGQDLEPTWTDGSKVCHTDRFQAGLILRRCHCPSCTGIRYRVILRFLDQVLVALEWGILSTTPRRCLLVHGEVLLVRRRNLWCSWAE